LNYVVRLNAKQEGFKLYGIYHDTHNVIHISPLSTFTKLNIKKLVNQQQTFKFHESIVGIAYIMIVA